MRGDVVPLRSSRGARGREQRGPRYAVVLQTDVLDEWATAIVAPTSTGGPDASFRPEVTIRGRRSRVLLDQIVALDRARLGRSIGRLNAGELELVDDALRFVLGVH